MPLKKTSEQFIDEARVVHGQKYDYSQSVYTGSATKLDIICPYHGKFSQTPNAHVSAGLGCRQCGNENKGKAKLKPLEQFIFDAKRIHDSKYDYSLVEYKNSKSKIKIICPIHGEFEQIPNAHLSGQACKLCGIAERSKNRTFTNYEFIEKARKINGDTLDYSLVEYKGNRYPVTLICPKHGEFQVIPDKHLSRKTGCQKCVSESKRFSQDMTKEEFIKRATLLHNGIYSYEKTNFSSGQEKVVIFCKIHGEFNQLPHVHLMGSGCQMCAGNTKLTTEGFKERAARVHNMTYDYTLSEYVNGKSDIAIICLKHGEFYQSAAAHLSGQGCIKCANREVLGRDRFIEKAMEVHGGYYDYSKVVYTTNKDDVEIICPLHGSFMQQAKGHLLRATGCPKCKLSSDSDAVYIWKAVGQYFNGEQVYKVGYTSARLAENRIRYVARKAGFDYEIIALENILNGDVFAIEKNILRLGSNPEYSGHSGASEFRAFTSDELELALSIIYDQVQPQG